MRIDGNKPVSANRGSAGTKASGGGSRFSLDIADAAQDVAPARSAPTVSGLDAMLALQSIEDPLERRRRQVKRGRGLLDALDTLKLALLDGRVAPADLMHLAALVKDGRETIEDPGLESVLAEIDVRAAVELAKLERRRP